MKHSRDDIRVGKIIFLYSDVKHGWTYPGLPVIHNPLKAQRLAELINVKRRQA